MKLLYYDKDLAIAQKPAGVLSQEGAGANMIALLREALGGEIFPVHRLDRETAGVMVFARTKAAAAALSDAIREGNFKKEYLAVTNALSLPEKGEMRDILFFDRQKNKAFPVKKERRGTKLALLNYELFEERDGLYLFRVFPQTGRTHQIRVQFASRKMPLAGDKKYGGTGEGFGLFARRITFFHPTEKKTVSFSAFPERDALWNRFALCFQEPDEKQ